LQFAVESIADELVIWPNSGALWPGLEAEPSVRTRGVQGFPYHTVYFVRQPKLVIMAIAQGRRKPGYWHNRLASA